MAPSFYENKDRDRHILKKDPKKWGTGDPLKLSSFFTKIVFLVLLYKTASKIFFKSTNFGYFWPSKKCHFSTKTSKISRKIELTPKLWGEHLGTLVH